MIWFPRFLSLASGFISLSLEILWVRFSGFAYRGMPQAFSEVLGLYLIGIAVGAAFGRRYCREGTSLLVVAGRILILAGLLDILLPVLCVVAFAAGTVPGMAALATAVVTTAFLKSMVFPIAHHLGSSTTAGRVGSSVSKVYFANILGSTLGPLATGFFLLDTCSLQQTFLLLAAATVALGLLCLGRAGAIRPAWSAAPVILGLGMLWLPNALMPSLIFATAGDTGGARLRVLIENRYGVIHTLSDGSDDDLVFGGNAYDGRINTDFLNDTNGITRAYILAALHPAPQRVLVIGLSGGSWARLVSGFASVQQLDIIEINPGYLTLIRHYPAVAPLLDDPRVRLHIDDGRRWLKRHPAERYDLIVMNTTFHWRAYTSLLLSQEFNALIRAHLNAGGIFAYNNTSLLDAFKTSSTAFGSLYVFGNLVIASDRDLEPELVHARHRLAAIRIDGRPMVDLAQPEVARKVDQMGAALRRFDPESRPGGRALEVITDQNMINEYKYGRTFLSVLSE